MSIKVYNHISWVLAALLLAIVAMPSCDDGVAMSNHVIVQNETFTLSGDSIIEDTIVACSPDGVHIASNLEVSRLDSMYGKGDWGKVEFVVGRAWRKDKTRPAGMPEYQSNQSLVDALYDMSVDRISQSQTGRHGRFAVKGNYSRLYCAIYLSLAHLCPRQSMETLRAVVDKDSIIMQPEGQWPVESDHIGWAAAAWEVYKATGDREWLAYSYHVVNKTLDINRRVLMDRRTGLIHGVGHTATMPLGPRRMTWMGYNDMFACMSLGNNILTAYAYSILADMCDEMGIEDKSFDKEAMRLKDAINQHLWNEDRGMYSSALYGMATPHQSPTTDNTSQAMCVLWGIADDDRAEYLVSNTPVGDCGVNVTYPAANAIEPYFVNPSWATTQALWNLAAANTGNENALRRGLGALYRAQALYGSRGIHLRGSETDELGTGASNTAMTLRVLMGMNFTPEGIEFAPIVPLGMPGKKSFKGFKYRQAEINVTIDGTGDDVDKIMDNGKPLESAFLPNDIQGVHNIAITLKSNNRSNQKVTIHRNDIVMPATPLVSWANDSGRIENYVAGAPYRLSVNGKLIELTDSVFAIPAYTEFTEFSVEVAGKLANSFMCKPLFKFSLTPQIAFLPADSTGTIGISVSVAEGGDYLIDVAYRATGTLDVRDLLVNTHSMGTLVMTQTKRPLSESDELIYSNMVAVKLLKGNNKVELRQIRLPKASTPCEAVHMRIIKR